MVSLLHGFASALQSNISLTKLDSLNHIVSICDCLSHILEHISSVILKHKRALSVDSQQVPASQQLLNATKLLKM